VHYRRFLPSLVDVLVGLPSVCEAVVTSLLLANAYHARVDIPSQIASCATATRVWQERVLGEDDRLVPQCYVSVWSNWPRA
jgi:sirohydrochlorin ferrochelatase